MEVIVDKRWYRTDVFHVVSDFPENYIVWNIGRQNFPHDGYIPLAEIDETFDDMCHIKTETLKTMFVGNELSDLIMKAAGKNTVSKQEFESIKNNWRK